MDQFTKDVRAAYELARKNKFLSDSKHSETILEEIRTRILETAQTGQAYITYAFGFDVSKDVANLVFNQASVEFEEVKLIPIVNVLYIRFIPKHVTDEEIITGEVNYNKSPEDADIIAAAQASQIRAHEGFDDVEDVEEFDEYIDVATPVQAPKTIVD